MKFIQHYSSSKGNFYELRSNNGKRLLIECGVTWREMLEALNYDLKGIVGCLISHEHKDHSKAVKEVLKAGRDVYASVGTLNALGIEEHRRSHSPDRFDLLREHGFYVRGYDATHDAVEPMMFTIECDDKTMLFATDTANIRWEFTEDDERVKFWIMAIENSYDGDILRHKVKNNEINEEFAKRLLASHLETKDCMRYLRESCDLSQCTELHLLHLSGGNNVRDRVKQRFEDEFLIETFIVGD